MFVRIKKLSSITIFGYPLPNYLPDLVSGRPSPWSISDQTTLFDVSSITEDHEVVVIFCDHLIEHGTTISIRWYRDRDNSLVTIWEEQSDVEWYGYAGWMGWLSQESATLFGLDEIRENGNYHVTITASGNTNFSYTINFAVTGMPARLS